MGLLGTVAFDLRKWELDYGFALELDCDRFFDGVAADHFGLTEPRTDDLARMGYLRPVSGKCAGHCAGCAIGGAAKSCAITGSGHLWTLTDKGARAAGQT